MHRLHVSHFTEYRYDSGRQRYLVRARDPNNNFAILGSGQWRDYLGEFVYNDYMVEVDETTGNVIVTPGTAYAPGIGFDDPALSEMPAYVGSDLIGTTRRVTDSAAAGAAVIERTVYTAFGERVSLTDGNGNPNASPVSRYGYAGAWGYEEAPCEPPGAPVGWCDPLTTLGWLHVGARYYDPTIGRFMQRDPIGIRGGLNTYEYLSSRPNDGVDSFGLDRWIDGNVHQAIIYGNTDIGYWKIEIGMYAPSWGPWWHWPKDAVEFAFRGALALTTGTQGKLRKTGVNKPKRPRDIITAVEEDKILHNKYKDGDTVYYSLWWSNCNYFVVKNQGEGTGH